MASTYVNDLRLNEMATGDQSGSWGTVTNTNLELIAEAFSYSTEAITTNADTHTTTIADGATDPGRSMFLKYTGTLDSACTITIGPNTVSKLWFIENATSGSQNIIIKQGSGATVTIASGKTKVIYSDGVGSAAKMVDAFAALDVGALSTTGDITFGDNNKAIFGAGSDLQIYHTTTGNHSIIAESGDGNLILAADNLEINNAANNANKITATTSGAVTLFHNNASKLATTSTGIDVTGGISSTARTDISRAADVPVLSTTNLENSSAVGLNITYPTTNVSGGDGLAIAIGISGRGRSYIANKNTDANLDASNLAFFTENGGVIGERVVIDQNGGFEVTPIAGGHAVFNEGSVDADFRVESDANTHMLFVDGGANSVGIGTSSPRVTAGVIGLTIGNSTTGGSELVLRENTGNDWRIFNNGYLGFIDDNTERMRIDESGNLLVGKSVTTQSTAGTVLYNTGQIYATASGTQPLVITRNTNDGAITLFYKDTNEAGRIATWDGDLAIGQVNVAFKFDDGGNQILPWSVNSNLNRDGGVDLGDSTSRWKDVHAVSYYGDGSNLTGVSSIIAQSTSANGYIKLVGGVIIQWGKSGSIGNSGNTSVTFPISFPNACLTVTQGVHVGSTLNSYAWSSGAPSTTGITFYSHNAIPATGMYYIAIGY